MNKYESPKIEIVELHTADVITSSGVTIGQLEGVDGENSKTAIYNAWYWITP